jgi:hypothetical protein
MYRLNWLRIRPIVMLSDNRDKCLFFYKNRQSLTQLSNYQIEIL